MAVKLTEVQTYEKTEAARDFICASEYMQLDPRTRRDLIAAAIFELADVRDSLTVELP